MTVALPTSGTNDDRIDITFSSGGTAGPTTDVLVDLVGYLDGSVLEGEIFVQTSVSGAILEGDELPEKDGVEYLDTTTTENDRGQPSAARRM